MTNAERHLITGQLFEAASDSVTAATVFRSLRRLKAPSRITANAHVRLGRIAWMHGDNQRAERHFKAALRRLSHAKATTNARAAANANLGTVRLSQGRLADALRFLRRAGRLYAKVRPAS